MAQFNALLLSYDDYLDLRLVADRLVPAGHYLLHLVF